MQQLLQCVGETIVVVKYKDKKWSKNHLKNLQIQNIHLDRTLGGLLTYAAVTGAKTCHKSFQIYSQEISTQWKCVKCVDMAITLRKLKVVA